MCCRGRLEIQTLKTMSFSMSLSNDLLRKQQLEKQP
jgi:hypothetical protein